MCPSGRSGLGPASSGTLLSATDPDSTCTCRAPTGPGRGPGRVPATFPDPCGVETRSEWRLERRSTDVALGSCASGSWLHCSGLRGPVTWCVQRKPGVRLRQEYWLDSCCSHGAGHWPCGGTQAIRASLCVSVASPSNDVPASPTCQPINSSDPRSSHLTAGRHTGRRACWHARCQDPGHQPTSASFDLPGLAPTVLCCPPRHLLY